MQPASSLPHSADVQRIGRGPQVVWPRPYPTAFGWTMLVLILCSWLLAINYSNNLLYAVVCLWLAIMLSSALLTGLSFRRVRVRGWQHEELFANSPNRLLLSLERAGFSGRLFISSGSNHEECVWLCSPQSAGRQDLQAPPLCAVDPLGLWCFAMPIAALKERMVFAKPVAHSALDRQQRGVIAHQEPDDIAGLRAYQNGDAWRQIDWNATARCAELISCYWQGEQRSDLHQLSWQDLAPMTAEQRQETLSAWVIYLFQQQQGWSLHLPGVVIAAGNDWQHRYHSLCAIAEVNL